MRKVHFKIWSSCEILEWREQQKREGLILDYVKICDNLMMLKKHQEFFTHDIDKVTCKKCLKKLKKLDLNDEEEFCGCGKIINERFDPCCSYECWVETWKSVEFEETKKEGR